MKKPLATLVTLVLVSTLFMGFATGPVAAQETCTSTATATNAGSAASVINTQNAIQVNLANNVQTGTAVSIGGDASVAQVSDMDQTAIVVQEQCDG